MRHCCFVSINENRINEKGVLLVGGTDEFVSMGGGPLGQLRTMTEPSYENRSFRVMVARHNHIAMYSCAGVVSVRKYPYSEGEQLC